MVYLGRVRSVGGFSRLVAIKTCLTQHLRDKAFVSMFLDEARIAARVRHPNVVATVDVDQSEELFLAMEYIEGERLLDLARAAAPQGGIPLSIGLRVMIDALNGLHAAHTQEDADGSPLNIVHRDISPHNILVGNDGLTRIADFGVARAERRLAQTLVGGMPKGKLAYMSPEQLLELPMDARSDVFSAGICAWEFFCGARLFEAESETALVAQLLDSPIQPPCERRDIIPITVSNAILKALSRKVETRFESAAAFAEALEKCGVPVATHRAVAEYLKGVAGERIEQRTALRRRVEAIPPLQDNPPAAQQPPAKSHAPMKTMLSTPGGFAPPPQTQPTPHAATLYQPPQPVGMMTGAPVNVPAGAHNQPSLSIGAWAAVMMACVGVVFGALGMVRRSHVRSEQSATRAIEVAPPVPLAPLHLAAQPPEAHPVANPSVLTAQDAAIGTGEIPANSQTNPSLVATTVAADAGASPHVAHGTGGRAVHSSFAAHRASDASAPPAESTNAQPVVGWNTP